MEASEQDTGLSSILGILTMYLYMCENIKPFCTCPLLIMDTSAAPVHLGKQWLLFKYDI